MRAGRGGQLRQDMTPQSTQGEANPELRSHFAKGTNNDLGQQSISGEKFVKVGRRGRKADKERGRNKHRQNRKGTK